MFNKCLLIDLYEQILTLVKSFPGFLIILRRAQCSTEYRFFSLPVSLSSLNNSDGVDKGVHVIGSGEPGGPRVGWQSEVSQGETGTYI